MRLPVCVLCEFSGKSAAGADALNKKNTYLQEHSVIESQELDFVLQWP